ncbi:kinase-like domain-containing protein [Multifurca ochricompacta]|uniref:Kinase-like domain-containing protein n=1 Tax=Multifurca ochricompacta TaxID=376703 RepID=A0AAD4QSD2_9AGAM|nr:kinase-like domain-containing protein [Multifurca ochricompacta]
MSPFDLTTPEGVLAYLTSTPFASERAEPRSGGNTNFIFRLYLNKPYEGHPTLILKHARSYVASAPEFILPVSRQAFEVDALRRVQTWLPPNARVTVPAVYFFDPNADVIIMDDAGPSAIPLKAALLEGRIPSPRAAALGTELGEFLRALHAWGRANVELREALGKNTFAREISAFVTYGRLDATLSAPGGNKDGSEEQQRLVSVLGNEPLGVSEDTLHVVKALAERRIAQVKESCDDTFVMGDFWPGNVLVGEENDPMLVVDWEIARPGLAGMDVGQFCAELATLRRLRPERGEAAGETLKNFVRAYFEGDVGPEIDETRRIALGHFGVHLAVWTPRTGWNGGVKATRALVLGGVARLAEGADEEKSWTDEEIVQKFMS